MTESYTESAAISRFRVWFTENGGYIHPATTFVFDAMGISVKAAQDIPKDAKIVSCPFSLAITPLESKSALFSFLGKDSILELEKWSEYQLIASYVVLHWLIEDDFEKYSSAYFKHLPYIHILPIAESLRTPHYFTPQEKELIQNTDVGKSAAKREQDYEESWKACYDTISRFSPQLKSGFTAQRFLAACTYISSRAFPSTILSPTPSLLPTPDSYPILLPGVDSLNHARGHPVTWLVNPIPTSNLTNPSYEISLLVHSSTAAHSELFNNYGPKSNAELLLGYGFVVPNNPEDVIAFEMRQPGCTTSRRIEIGRLNRGIEPLWEQMVAFTKASIDDPEKGQLSEWQLNIEAGQTFLHFLKGSQNKIPQIPSVPPNGVRPDVFDVIQVYIEGVKQITNDMILFAKSKVELGRNQAEALGIEYEEGSDEEQ